MRRLILAGLCFFCTAVHAYSTYVLTTYGDAAALATVAQAQLTDGGSVTPYQNQLIIHASPSDYARIQSLLTQIDTPATPLTLSLKVGQNTHAQHQGGQLNVGIRQGVWLNGNYHNHSTHRQDSTLYQVQGLTGRPMTISQSTLIGLSTYPSHSLWQIRLPSTHWVSLTGGIHATPYLLPDGQIRLTISQSHAQGTRQQQLSSELITKKGQWVQIGSIRQSQHSTSYASSTAQLSELPIWLKVD